jgi:hypothetical protein
MRGNRIKKHRSFILTVSHYHSSSKLKVSR